MCYISPGLIPIHPSFWFLSYKYWAFACTFISLIIIHLLVPLHLKHLCSKSTSSTTLIKRKTSYTLGEVSLLLLSPLLRGLYKPCLCLSSIPFGMLDDTQTLLCLPIRLTFLEVLLISKIPYICFKNVSWLLTVGFCLFEFVCRLLSKLWTLFKHVSILKYFPQINSWLCCNTGWFPLLTPLMTLHSVMTLLGLIFSSLHVRQ